MDAMLSVERELLERYIAQARKQFGIIERCDNVTRLITIEINMSETTETEDLIALLGRVERARAAAQAVYDDLAIRIRRLRASSGSTRPPPPPTRPPPTGNIPPPPEGVVDLRVLDALVMVEPQTKIFTTWGTAVKYPEMKNQWHKVPNPLGTHALINQPGTGPDGVWATKTAPLLLSNCWLEATGSTGFGPHTRWNCRGFGPADWSVIASYIFNNPDEHGFYLNSIWNLKFEKNKFKEIKSQALQIVWREHETDDFDAFTDPYGNGTRSQILVDSCSFEEIGQQAGGRPSFANSFFEVQPWVGIRETDVIVQGSYYESQKYQNFEKSGGPYYSYGAIMIHGYRDVYIRKNAIRYKKPNREVIQVWGCDNVTIEGCEIGDPYGGDEVLIDIRNSRGKVTIKGNTGNAIVKVLKDGPVYWWQNLKFDYEGPVTTDIEL